MEQFDDYRTDFTYISHYTYKISPRFMEFALLLQGIDMPAREPGEPYRYLELGFGRGNSLMVHTASNEGEYWGVDFLPQHCEEAQKIVDEARINCRLLNNSFAEVDEMGEAGDLPQFDAIVFHGIWSWINAENRGHILNILRRNLKKGGVVYVSYNAEPGWAFFEPVRDMMLSMIKRYGDDVPMETRIRETLRFVTELSEREVAFFKLNKQSVKYLKDLGKQDIRYLAQEYFNTTWDPFYFREVAEDMEKAGCAFAVSADLFAMTGLYVHPGAMEYISQSINPIVRETLRDFAVNNKFRMDYFVKEPRRLNGRELQKKLGELALKMSIPRDKVNLSFNVNYNTVSIRPEVFNPLLDAIDSDGGVAKKVGDITGDLLTTSEGRKQVIEYLAIMESAGYVMPFNENPPEAATEATRRLNRVLCKYATGPAKQPVLASAKMGRGCPVNEVDQMFLLNYEPGMTDAEALARRVVDQLYKQGLKGSYQDTVNAHIGAAHSFLMDRLPAYERMGIELQAP